LATKATQFGEITQNTPLRITPFKVTDFGTNRKPLYGFLLVINTNLPPILHRFQDMTDYNVKFSLATAGRYALTPSLGAIPYEYYHK